MYTFVQRNTLSLAVAVIMGIAAAACSGQANAQTPAPIVPVAPGVFPLVWDLVPDGVEQPLISVDGVGADHITWNGANWLQSTDGKGKTFRRQFGSGKYRIEFDPARTRIVYNHGCRQVESDFTHADPRYYGGGWKTVQALDCDSLNQVELFGLDIQFFPASTQWQWKYR